MTAKLRKFQTSCTKFNLNLIPEQRIVHYMLKKKSQNITLIVQKDIIIRLLFDNVICHIKSFVDFLDVEYRILISIS